VHGQGSAAENAQAGPGNNEGTLAPGWPRGGGGGGGGGAPAVGGDGGGEGQEGGRGGMGGAASTGQVEILKSQYPSTLGTR
jgi:translation initiation factor IF-2